MSDAVIDAKTGHCQRLAQIGGTVIERGKYVTMKVEHESSLYLHGENHKKDWNC
jgi:hypothetical protein